MWIREGEQHMNEHHHYNRYGVQLGIKVPLWGGFTRNGHFSLREWTPRQKITMPEWTKRIPALKRAVEPTSRTRRISSAKVWQDNEKFLFQPRDYKAAGLQLECFPPNSGDLNPIVTVWAWLRRDLAKREQVDVAAGVVLTVQQFTQRAAQRLKSYGVKKPEEKYSSLEKLVRGMPRRLQQCKKRCDGRCGM
jgi:transposase